MATSFLPFCAHCEQQIVVPNTSILYCSEKCRRKDQSKPPPLPIGPSSCPPLNPNWITPPLTPSHQYSPDSHPQRNYVEPSCPTPPRSVPRENFPEYAGSKPISITGRPGETARGPASAQTSPNTSQPSSPTNNNSNIYMPTRRPPHLRTLTGSSLSLIISNGGCCGGGGGGGGGSDSNQANGLSQYQLNQQRPLPPLHNPHSHSSSPRSIELVTPYLSSALPPQYKEPKKITHTHSHSVDSSELRYEKRSTLPPAAKTGKGGSLKTLFNFDAIRSKPLVSTNTTQFYAYSTSSRDVSPNGGRYYGSGLAGTRGLGVRSPILTVRSGGWPM